jgi:phosphatidylinositol-3-phosphatase
VLQLIGHGGRTARHLRRGDGAGNSYRSTGSSKQRFIVPLHARPLAALALIAAVVGGCGGVSVTFVDTERSASLSTPSPIASATQAALPQFAHIYVLVLENEEYGSLVGSAKAPFLNGLIAKYGLAMNYNAVAHPSQPNYVALFSGSTQGLADDASHDLPGTNLADQLAAHAKSWAVYAQDYPGNCFTGATNDGSGEGIGSAGTYVRKHNPAISFTDIATDPARCARIMDLSQFDPAATDFSLIVPNECNDMHSCSVSIGDAFLQAFVPRITGSQAFNNSVLFITTDEGTSSKGGGGRVATVVVSPLVSAGFTTAALYDHYSLLRTIEDSWGLGCLGQACSSDNMGEFFH